jgi:anthranilate phosphoribosyltransferase
MIREAIKKVVEGDNLSCEEMAETMNEIMSGRATDAQIASFITALRLKGETIEEITGAAKVMREKATKINTRRKVVDTCGTGGDGASTFNISTISAFVVAGAGIAVAKHGNRSVSSKCGSADLLKALGINIEIPPQRVEEAIENIGFGFLFAPLLHGAMKFAIGPRQQIGIRTIFNILGPLTNPAGADCQLLGVYDPNLTEPLAETLKNLGSKRAFLVHGEDGLDEITITGKTRISELKERNVSTYYISPEEFGLDLGKPEEIKGSDPTQNAKLTLEILDGRKRGPARDIVLLNSAYALLAADAVETPEQGIKKAEESIDSKAALNVVERLREFTNR